MYVYLKVTQNYLQLTACGKLKYPTINGLIIVGFYLHHNIHNGELKIK